MKTFALIIGYVLLLGGISVGVWVWAAGWVGDEENPLVRLGGEIAFFAVAAAILGSIVLILNGEDVLAMFD